jgi:hypothetical protein
MVSDVDPVAKLLEIKGPVEGRTDDGTGDAGACERIRASREGAWVPAQSLLHPVSLKIEATVVSLLLCAQRTRRLTSRSEINKQAAYSCMVFSPYSSSACVHLHAKIAAFNFWSSAVNSSDLTLDLLAVEAMGMVVAET